ncbi:MAG: class I SAM-dependent methyltransferase [Pseudonocardiaceae bacterium]
MSELAPAVAEQLKAGQRSLWASGDYAKLSADLLSELGRTLVEACGVTRGQRVLDVAAGAGNAALPAAQAGAGVVASDLTPELFATGRRHAAERGVELEWVEADAEALPFGDGEFDTVLSCIGVMFAPRHQRAADELLRVCRPGGTLGLINWTLRGFVGQLFTTIAPHTPPPPPGAQSPLQWGSEDHVATLFGDRVTDLVAQRRTLRFDRFGTVAEYLDYLKSYFGPVIAAYRFNAEDAERTAALERDLLDFMSRCNEGGAAGDARFSSEYLLVTARRSDSP